MYSWLYCYPRLFSFIHYHIRLQEYYRCNFFLWAQCCFEGIHNGKHPHWLRSFVPEPTSVVLYSTTLVYVLQFIAPVDMLTLLSFKAAKFFMRTWPDGLLFSKELPSSLWRTSLKACAQNVYLWSSAHMKTLLPLESCLQRAAHWGQMSRNQFVLWINAKGLRSVSFRTKFRAF